MIRALRQFLCRHRGMIRENRNGARLFVCPHCGYAEPQIARAVPITYDVPAHERMKAQPAKPAEPTYIYDGYRCLISYEGNFYTLPEDAAKNIVLKDIS